MPHEIAIVGSGVMGLTAAVVLSENGHKPVVFAEESAMRTTSSVAAAVWFPYDAEPEPLVTAWALLSYGCFVELSGMVPDPKRPNDTGSGVSMIDFEYRSACSDVQIPSWAHTIGYSFLRPSRELGYMSGFQVRVPLIDTSRYLDYLRERSKLPASSFQIRRLHSLDEVPDNFKVIVNCSGYGARGLVPDINVSPHRGQVVVVPKQNNVRAFVLDEPLTYVIPRNRDCILGGVNLESDSSESDHETTDLIVTRCTEMANLPSKPEIIGEPVGIRPARKGGIRLEATWLKRSRRLVVHNYGHGGCGLSLSWGCTLKVLALVESLAPQVENTADV